MPTTVPPRERFRFLPIATVAAMVAVALPSTDILAAEPAPGVVNPAADPLPSWRDGVPRKRLLEFISAATTVGGDRYLPGPERIAVFDDDGTLWPEKPRAQGMFALRRLRAAAPAHPDWQTRMPFAAALQLGSKYLQEAPEAAVAELIAASHAGLSQDAFRAEVSEYFATASHPRYGVPYSGLAYQPMLELIGWLRANGFRVFIVTSGSADLMRVLSNATFGIPAEQVFGSRVTTEVRDEGDRLVIRRTPAALAAAVGREKPLLIDAHVGRRPALAVGNIGSASDIEMLRFSQQSPGPSLQMLIRHDDFEREFAYEDSARESMDAAEKHGWTVVSMRFDWKRVFAFDPPRHIGAAVAAHGF